MLNSCSECANKKFAVEFNLGFTKSKFFSNQIVFIDSVYNYT